MRSLKTPREYWEIFDPCCCLSKLVEEVSNIKPFPLWLLFLRFSVESEDSISFYFIDRSEKREFVTRKNASKIHEKNLTTMEGISFIFLSYLRCENIIQILEFLCIEYNIRMEFWKIDQTPRIDFLVNYFPVILISYRNRKGIIEVIPIFSILQPEAFAELNFCLQIPSGVRLFVFFFFSTK